MIRDKARGAAAADLGVPKEENHDSEYKAEMIRRLASTTLPGKWELLILAVGVGKDRFSSGEVLRETGHALGEPISITTLHRLLGTLVERRLLNDTGPMMDFVSKRAVIGYSLTEAGKDVLRHADSAALAIPLSEVA